MILFCQYGLDDFGFSFLRITYLDPTFIAFTRSELFDDTGRYIYQKKISYLIKYMYFLEFIAACGGLLGLFVGFSIFSLFEFLYFFSIRIFCNMRIRKHVVKPKVLVTDSNPEEEKYSSTAQKILFEYSERCALDGIKYIGDITRHWTERYLTSLKIDNRKILLN